MLFWTKLLTVAHSVTTSVHPFLPLYFTHMLHFDILTITILTACVLILRIPASAFWIDLVDHRPPLHGVFTGLLTAMGTAGVLLILSVPPTWTANTLPVAIFSSIFDGLFFQPLLVLIDSAIIKILGDYKILYANERQYGKFVSAIMSLIIGWFLDDDHDFDTLMVTTLLGSVGLFLLSLSTNVQAADPSLLGIDEYSREEFMDEPLFLTKHDLNPLAAAEETTSLTSTERGGSYFYYKPYSLFGEQLSHISEEDASMLQRMATTTDNYSIKPSAGAAPPPRPASNIKGDTYVTTTAEDQEDSIVSTCQQKQQIFSHFITIKPQCDNTIPKNQLLLQENLPPSFELARLPYPPPEAPVIVLITLFPGYYQKHNYRNPSQLPPPLLPIPPQQQEEEYIYLQCSLASHYQQQSKWIVKSFLSSTFCLGVSYGLTQSLVYLYLHDTLKFPMHLIGVIGFIMVSADLLASQLVICIIQQFHLSVIIACAHIVLIICALTYTWLQPAGAELFVIILQSLQGLSFHSTWLLAAHQVDAVVLTGHKRMMLKGGMAALYSGIGPAIGVLLVGYLVSQYGVEEGYTLVYLYAAGFTTLSAILSWEWSTTN